MAAAQTSAGRDEGGSSPRPVEHDPFLEEMNRQHRAGIPNLDNVGDGRMDYDGPRCSGDDCRVPVANDGELCDYCADNPHEFMHDGSRFDFCVCGRIRSIGGYSPVHHGWADQ